MFMIKVTRPKLLASSEKPQQMRNVKALLLMVQKLRQSFKFLKIYVKVHSESNKVI